MKKTKHFLHDTYQASRLLKPLADLFVQLKGQTVAIGLSAGADSAMLALCAAELCEQYKVEIRLLHIHHGLMAEADEWMRQGQALAKQLQLPFEVVFVEVNRQSGLGIEAAAREARYQAFIAYAKQHHIQHFLLAHHLDDQAETLLLRLLRGSGVRGMRGMQKSKEKEGVIFHRPWLECDRGLILELAKEFAKTSDWYAVKDQSNTDILYKRGAVRVALTPALNKHWPSWKQNLARHARLMAEAQAIVDDMARLDFQTLLPSDTQNSFCLKAWRELPDYRQGNVLRYWIALFDLQMPTDKRLTEWLKQLREVHQLGFDREVRLPHEGKVIVVSRGRVTLNE